MKITNDTSHKKLLVELCNRNKNTKPSIFDYCLGASLGDDINSRFLNISLKRFPFTFHNCRRGGTAWGFQHGVPLKELMQHGT